MRHCLLAVAVVALVSATASAINGVEGMTDEALYAEWAAHMDEVLPEWDAHEKYWEEDLGWQAAPALRGLVNGYRYSGDEKWLRYLIVQVDELMRRLTVEDGHPGWGHSITGEALVLKPILDFIYVAQTDPGVSAETKAKAQEYLEVIDPGMITKWDAMGRWHETAMGCATYDEGISLPHNKNARLGMLLLAAARVTPSAERCAEYLGKARKLARRWKKHLKVRGDHYIWHYWDPAGRWDYAEDGSLKHWVGLEHRSYGSSDTGFMAAAYDHGLVFTRQDVEMHCRTFLKEIWNWDSDDPQYRALGTFNPQYVRASVFNGLARFDPKIMELWGRSATRRPRSWGGMSGVPAYLVGKAAGVSFERRYADWVRKALEDRLAAEAAQAAQTPPEDEGLIR